MRPRSPGGREIANAHVRTVVDFLPTRGTQEKALQGEIASRLQGAGGTPYHGDRGDPAWSFYGTTVGVQRFVSAAPVVGIRLASGSYHEPHPTIDTAAVGDSPYADPAARIFAQRMVRRS